MPKAKARSATIGPSSFERLRRRLVERFRVADSPELSVIVPAYNTAPYIEVCLESIMAQKITSIEVLVVNDGSTDTTAEIVRGLAVKYPQIQLFNRRHAGLGATRNYGLKKARGRYFSFVDSDDSLTPRTYRLALASLRKTGSDLAIFGIVHSRGGSLTFPPWTRFIHDHNRRSITVEEFPAVLRDFYSPNKIYRAEFWRAAKARFRQVPLFEDQPLMTQLLCRAASIDILRHPGYHWQHRAAADSISDSMRHAAGIRARAEATALTRPIITATSNSAVLRAWLYTIIENQLLTTYLAHLDELDAEAVIALPALVRAAGRASDILLSPLVSPAAAVLARLTYAGRVDLVAKLVQAGWTGPARAWLRGQTGRQQLLDTLGQAALNSLRTADAGPVEHSGTGSSATGQAATSLGGLADCFSGRQPDPQRLTVRLTMVAWLEDGSLAISGRIPLLTGFARNSAHLTVAVEAGTREPLPLVSAQAKLRELNPSETNDPDTWPEPARQIGQLTGFDAILPNLATALIATAAEPQNRSGSWPVQFQINVTTNDTSQPGIPQPLGPAEYQLDQTGWNYIGHTAIRPKPYPSADQRRFFPTANTQLTWSCKDRHWLRLSLAQLSN